MAILSQLITHLQSYQVLKMHPPMSAVRQKSLLEGCRESRSVAWLVALVVEVGTLISPVQYTPCLIVKCVLATHMHAPTPWPSKFPIHFHAALYVFRNMGSFACTSHAGIIVKAVIRKRNAYSYFLKCQNLLHYTRSIYHIISFTARSLLQRNSDKSGKHVVRS